MESFQIRSFFWSIFSYIQSEYRKTRTRKNPVFGHFSRSETLARKQSIALVGLIISLKKLYILFQCFNFCFPQTSKCLLQYTASIQSRDLYAIIGQLIRQLQSYVRKPDIFISGKEQDAIRAHGKIYSLLLYHFCMIVTIFKVSYITFYISTT